MMTGGYAVETAGLTKRFGDRTAVDRVSLRVPAGTAFGYLGPNGAGKTTLIRMLLGLTRADEGSMRLLGYPVPAQRAAALLRVGAMAEEPRFLDHLTGRENLRINAAARELAAAGRIEGALERVGLRDRAGERVARHAPAAGGGPLPASRPAAADLGRAHQRAGPGRSRGVPRNDRLADRRRAHGDAVVAPAR